MKYSELNNLYKNNLFGEINADLNAEKFYLLRSISKKATLRKFCCEYSLSEDLNAILEDTSITVDILISFIRQMFSPKTPEEISAIEAELNKMQNFDWGGSAGNNLEKNIVNNYIKKTLKYEDIELAISGPISRSVYGYTLNSWYNHWSSIMIEEIFNSNERILPTVDLIEKIDFFLCGIPFDLKVTYFPEELLKTRISDLLKTTFGSKSELSCTKKIARELNITIPKDLESRALTICLQKLLKESVDTRAAEFLRKLADIKNTIYEYYFSHPNELIIWLYENQGEMRFDAANRFYIVLIDRENPFDGWKLKRNQNLLRAKISNKVKLFDRNNLNEISFYWHKDAKTYKCYSEILFVYR